MEIERYAVEGVPEPGQQKQADGWSPSLVAWSLFLFFLAGLFEIGGGWLVFVGMRDPGRQPRAMYLLMGSLVLVAYGFIPTLQPSESFGRIFAVYGGFFIVGSYLFGYVVDGDKLDTGDYIGAALAIIGVCIAWFWPR